VCVCIYVCTRVRMHASTYACLYMSTCTVMCICIVRIYVYIALTTLVVINTCNMSQSLILHQEVTTYPSPRDKYFLAYEETNISYSHLVIAYEEI